MTTNYDAERKTSDVEKIKNRFEQNTASNMQSDDEDTQRSNFNSKSLNLTLVLNIRILLFLFIVFNTCEERYDIAIRIPNKRP